LLFILGPARCARGWRTFACTHNTRAQRDGRGFVGGKNTRFLSLTRDLGGPQQLSARARKSRETLTHTHTRPPQNPRVFCSARRSHAACPSRDKRAQLRRANSLRLLFVSFSPSVLSARWQSGIWQHGQSLVRHARPERVDSLLDRARQTGHTHTHTFTLGSRTLRRGAKKAIERLEVTRRSGGPPELSFFYCACYCKQQYLHRYRHNNSQFSASTCVATKRGRSEVSAGREAQRGCEACDRRVIRFSARPLQALRRRSIVLTGLFLPLPSPARGREKQV
jgi:hypothetical protein